MELRRADPTTPEEARSELARSRSQPPLGLESWQGTWPRRGEIWLPNSFPLPVAEAQVALRYLAAQHRGPALPGKRHDQHRHNQHRHNQPRTVEFRRRSLPVSQHLPRLDRLAPLGQEQVGVELDWTEAAGEIEGHRNLEDHK